MPPKVERHNNKAHDGNIIAPALLVIVLSLGAAMLLLVAFVTWLSELLGSLCISLLLTSAALGIAAWVTYRIKLSEPLRALREEYHDIVTLVAIIKRGYDCAVARIAQILALIK